MPTEVLMPKLGLTMTEGTVARWLVQEGQPVKAGEVLFEVENDKAIHEIEAQVDGFLGRVVVEENSVVPVGQVIGHILAPGETIDNILAAELTSEAQRLTVSSSGPETQTAPASAPIDGVIRASPSARRLARELSVDLAIVIPTGPGGRIVARDVQRTAEAPVQPVKASPVARRLARELGVDLVTVSPTGPGGRIVAEDVRRGAGRLATLAEVHFAGVRRLIAERMTASLQNSAQLTLTRDVDATALVEMRNQLNAGRADNKKVSYDAIFAYSVSRALQEHPALNARLDDDTILQLASVNVGVAVDTKRGLLVPVIKEAGSKDVEQISDELRELLRQIENNEIVGDDLTGGTFTISNLGQFGIDAFTPILNPPECAILGIGRLRPMQVIQEDPIQVTTRQMMMLSLSFDHRLVDGAPAARFLAALADMIETPEVS